MTRSIRTLALPEIRRLLDWAAAEGWNPGRDDAPAFQAADPDGFLGAFVDGVMVAAISAVAYDDHFGFIGLYICHRDWRGQGHGRAVWDAGMDYLGGRTIGLDGVAEQQSNYASMGFFPAYETVRMSGTLPATPTVNLPSVRLEDIRSFDRICFPAPRAAFLRLWLAPPRRSVMRVSDGKADGYAVIRSCCDGAKIGPLFADSTQTALELLAGLSGDVQIDVPAYQTAWQAALVERGLTAGFTTRRMYRGAAPAMDLGRVFGVTSLELG